MLGFLSKLARFFRNLRRPWLLATSRRNSVLRQIAGWGIPAIGLALACAFFWEDLWAHAERIRNLALVAAAAVGLPIAAWRSSTAHRQAETAQNSLLTERYQRAAEMLGGEEAVCLAGIYTLTHMAQSNLTHHVLIMSALSAVVRTSAARENISGTRRTSADVTAIMEALGARNPEQILMEKWENYKLNLRAVDLRGLSVNKVMLRRATLDDAIFSDSENRAILLDADFEDASLVSARLDAAFLLGANFASANLTFASLTGAILGGSDLRQATLSNTDFSNAEFTKADIEDAILTGTDLTNVTGLTQQQLNSARIDPSHPPILTGATDPDTGKPLVIPS